MSNLPKRELIRIAANKSRLEDCLNEAFDLSELKTELSIKHLAFEIYKNKGFNPLPFSDKIEVTRAYFN